MGFVAKLQQIDEPAEAAAPDDPVPTDPYAALADLNPDAADPDAAAGSPDADPVDADPVDADPADLVRAGDRAGGGPSWDGPTEQREALFGPHRAPAFSVSGAVRPRPAIGRVELPWADPPSPAAVIDITPTSAAPSAANRRRVRAGLVTAAALAVLVAGGVGYARLRDTEAPTTASEPPPPAARTPSPDAPAPGLPAVPGADPIPRTPSVTPTKAAVKPAARAVPTPAGSSPSRRPTRTTRPVAPVKAEPVSDRRRRERPVPVATKPADDSFDHGVRYRPLAAKLTAAQYTGPDGVPRYDGTITITNPGRQAVDDGWEVILTVPGGLAVVAKGVDVEQDGDWVSFTPYEDTDPLPSGATLTFTFSVVGLPPAAPSGCAIDGNACA
jgi:hypothetical protein